MADLLDAHMRLSTDDRALVWPRPSHNLTFVSRRPQHLLDSQAGYKSWRHPLAPKLPISQYHTPAPNPETAAQTDGAQVAPPESKESQRRPQRGPETPHQDQDLDLHPPRNLEPDYSERPVADYAQSAG